jgi:hypothetical protein
MMKIDDKISDIKPHILTMRYQGELSIIDVKLKQGWRVDESKLIGIKKYPDMPNTYMFFSPEVGLDGIIEFVRDLINMNIEIEKKEELLRAKTAELQEFFTSNSLEDLYNLEFNITGKEEMSDLPSYVKIDEEGEHNNLTPIVNEIGTDEPMTEDVLADAPEEYTENEES